MSTSPRHWISVLRASHGNLADAVAALGPDRATDQSYCRDWSVAQVLSHLGSGAEISLLTLRSAIGEGEPVGQEAFPAIWDRWNAKAPADQIADGLAADEEYVSRLEQLTDAELDGIKVSMFGMHLDAVGLIGLRLSEHSMHTWDVAVIADPAARVPADAVDLVIDNVSRFLAPRLGKPQDPPLTVHLVVTGPARDWVLTAADAVTVTEGPVATGAGAGGGVAVSEVRIPGEALLRLAYGRLDPAHTPAEVEADPAVLERLRAVFPGF
jgi:uncharacterized protein (TIGR03083 family)